uniref:Ribosomal protein L34 n=1 Tax=Ophidocladus simpliciusculus TaxID=1261574 RepID=A0A1Z1MIW9_9FLOR|nr:ribosomal protein L34 [Ophidocladus simpliciusculus]ARW65896.1 ribosomal protein L34 [Ophidocladus simpliciusculus]
MKTGTQVKKIKKSGFLVRMKTKSGQRIINARRKKKRKKINL